MEQSVVPCVEPKKHRVRSERPQKSGAFELQIQSTVRDVVRRRTTTRTRSEGKRKCIERAMSHGVSQKKLQEMKQRCATMRASGHPENGRGTSVRSPRACPGETKRKPSLRCTPRWSSTSSTTRPSLCSAAEVAQTLPSISQGIGGNGPSHLTTFPQSQQPTPPSPTNSGHVVSFLRRASTPARLAASSMSHPAGEETPMWCRKPVGLPATGSTGLRAPRSFHRGH